jgi:hypothetical protein
VLSFTAIEMGLPGFGLETLADITHGEPGTSAFLPPAGSPRCSSPVASASSSDSSPFRP